MNTTADRGIDWSSIPIYLRCTCREKIDPTYSPGKFWAVKPPNAEPDRAPNRNAKSRSKYAPLILEALAGGEMTSAQLSKAIGTRSEVLTGILGGLSHTVPIYERDEGNRKVYGLMTRAEKN